MPNARSHPIARQALPAPVFRTVRSLGDVPGGDGAALAEVGRRLSVRHRVRFVVLDDEREAVSRAATPTGGADDGAVRRAAA